MRRQGMTGLVAGLVLWGAAMNGVADEGALRAMPPPDMAGGKPLMQALKGRATSREFKTNALPDAVLGNLLWAAAGVNRPDSGKRTAPSAVNWQEIDVYAAGADGLYRYVAAGHALEPILKEDIRKYTGIQEFVVDAPVVLVYVADRTRMKGVKDDDRTFYEAVDTGFISQNVYLFCASEGLATVVLGMVDKPVLHKVMKLRPEQDIILTQPVGYPASVE